MRLVNGFHVLGWGYEGRSVDELVSDAAEWGVATVIDVRLNPVSRKPGFSKRKLAERLEGAAVQYVHLPALGNPRDNRAGFADPHGPEGRDARERFKHDVLGSDAAEAALVRVLELATSGSVMLLCYEADSQCCHRSLVLEAVRRRTELLPA